MGLTLQGQEMNMDVILRGLLSSDKKAQPLYESGSQLGDVTALNYIAIKGKLI